MSLHPSKIDLPAQTREGAVRLLNARLADAVNLMTQIKQAHWNVKGPHFIALHEFFDTLHGAIVPHVDDIAERITTLGGTAYGTAAVAAEKSELPAYPLDIHEGPDHIEALSRAFAEFAANVRKAIDQAEDLGDVDTVDLFTQVSRMADKSLWLLEAHLQAKS